MSEIPLVHRMRQMTPADLPMIINAWVSEHRHAPAARFVRDREYFADQRALVVELLHTSFVLVACGDEDPSHIYGFIVFGPGNVVHWVYVKSSYRRVGLADALLKAAFPNRTEDLYASQAGRMWAELEPSIYDLRRRHGQNTTWKPGALSRRRIFYRPHLLMRAS